ncbi:MAG: (Fe-S)-binding protein [Deltaproteobacteria bacterium]|nr:(Fe-S)-binding protein [Deltaproteobacteria bacterium]
MDKLKGLTTETEKCARCGTCRSTCPTFRVLGREGASARGKLSLIRAYLGGEVSGKGVYARHIKECALCGACKDSCPNGVDTVGVFAAARSELAAREGLPFAASFIMKSLLEPGRLMPAALKFASRLQGLLLKDSSVESGLLPRFSLPVVGDSRLLPPLAKVFFLDMPEVRALPETNGKDASIKQINVAFYAGCGVNYLMPETGLFSIRALKRAGASVTVPASQICCGMPAYSMGDVATARGMALKNLEVFERGGFDFIVTSCATCGYALKTMFKKLLGDDAALKDRVAAFSSKVRDLSEMLVNELRYKVFKGEVSGKGSGKKITVTYHDPCHLNRAQGIRREPREMLANAPGVEFKEMKFPCACCGLGGGLSTTNYELSIEIARRKAQSVKDSGADVLATACPGCIVQLRDAMHRYGVDVKVVHVVDLL